eukprot:29411_1
MHGNTLFMFILDRLMHGVFYVNSIACLDAVFLVRIWSIFPPGSPAEVKQETFNRLWVALIVLALTGNLCILLVAFQYKVIAYLPAVPYTFLVYALSSYLLRIFVSKLKMYESLCSKDKQTNLEILKLIVKTNFLAHVAIYSTLISMSIALLMDMLKTMFVNDVRFLYIQRDVMIIDR